LSFKLHPWRRSLKTGKAPAARAVRTLPRLEAQAPATAMPLSPSSQLTGAQRAKQLLRLRISALSGLREHDKLDLPPVDPGTRSESEN
jgi:hypothetical protein